MLRLKIKLHILALALIRNRSTKVEVLYENLGLHSFGREVDGGGGLGWCKKIFTKICSALAAKKKYFEKFQQEKKLKVFNGCP